MLVASELVTNAVLHSGCKADYEIKISVGIREERLVIAVVDPGLSGRDAQVRENPTFGGFGLQIVDHWRTSGVPSARTATAFGPKSHCRTRDAGPARRRWGSTGTSSSSSVDMHDRRNN